MCPMVIESKYAGRQGLSVELIERRVKGRKRETETEKQRPACLLRRIAKESRSRQGLPLKGNFVPVYSQGTA